MAKKKKRTIEEMAFPIAKIPTFAQPTRPAENPNVIRQIILGAIQGAYHLKTPIEPSPCSYNYGKKQPPLVTQDQIQFVTHLIESLQPTDAIEAALASQFVISYIRGLDASTGSYSIDHIIRCFEFGHQVIETLTKYRTKGAQQIQVNYNHNQGQINNIKVVEKEDLQPIIEVN